MAMPQATDSKKASVQAFWEDRACGEVYATGDSIVDQLERQRDTRYELEPYLRPFAGFDGKGREVLEIGVGMGADHAEWQKSSPRRLIGIDLTSRACHLTALRLQAAGAHPALAQADAENLPFPTGRFDIVYSWGVLHHTPSTERAVAEVHRVLRPGGEARIMVYHRPSVVGYLLWARYGLGAARPGRSLADIYARHLESPGTRGFTVQEGYALVSRFSQARVRSQLTFGDLLLGEVGQRHQSLALSLAKRIWPRQLIARMLPGHGLNLLISAQK